MAKKCVLLINLGTPDSPSVGDVRKYLREFLMDKRVIDIPFIQRFFLVNCIIAPFRAPQSAKIYKELWTKEGSPLKIHGLKLKELLQKELGDKYHVAFAMRYQSPNIRAVLRILQNIAFDEILIIPLYPQYASSSSGSTLELVLKDIGKWENIPQLKTVSQFAENPYFLEAFSSIGKEYMKNESYDHYLFSYHGLPERQIRRAAVDSYCQINEKCCAKYHDKNKLCYRAQCYQTSRLLAKQLGVKEKDYTVCFQSRLGKDPWIKPYTDEMIHRLLEKGVKKVLVFSPAFVADCLETTIEIGVEYKKIFMDNGGQRWDLVQSLNTNPIWVKCLKNICLEMLEKSK